MLNAQMDIKLWHPEHIPNDENELWPQWFIHVLSFPGENGVPLHFHELNLTRSGELISWAAHGAEFYEYDPDILHAGTKATPLPTDATEEKILQTIQTDLKSVYGVINTHDFTYEVEFIYEEHFNLARIPVWMVYVYQDNQLLWKGVYGYNGCYMSLVPAKQDFYCYNTPGEDFFEDTYNDPRVENDKARQILFQEVSGDVARQWIDEWLPYYQEWESAHPYSALYQPIHTIIDNLYELYPELNPQ